MKVNRCLQRLGLWKGNPPFTYFLKNYAFLKVDKLSAFQSPHLASKVSPRGSRSQAQCLSLLECDPILLREEYDDVNRRDPYGQEKLSLLPGLIIHDLREGKVDSAIKFSEEYLTLNGGMSSLKKGADMPEETRFGHSALLPAVNYLSLKFMKLKELKDPSSALILDMNEVAANYRLCLLMAKKYHEPTKVQEFISDNFFNVSERMREEDTLLLNIDKPYKLTNHTF